MKHIKVIVNILIVLFPLFARADKFVHFDWTNFAKSGNLPEASWSLDTDGDASCNYSVSVEYPEWVPMTHAEREQLKRLGVAVPEQLTVRSQQLESRKKAVLDVVVVPVMNDKGKWMKLMSCKLSVAARRGAKAAAFANVVVRSMTATAASRRYTTKSVLSSGKWAKIRVASEGVYSLTPSFLKSLGFTNPSRVKVYGYGGRPRSEIINTDGDQGHYDDLEEVPLLKRSNDWIFHANGTVAWSAWTYNSTAKRYTSSRKFNPYSSYSYYFVTEGDSAMAFPHEKETTGTVSTELTTFPDHQLIENDAFSWLNSGRNLYDDYNYANGNVKKYALNLASVDTSEYVSLEVKFSASNSTYTRVQFNMNDEKNDSMSISKISDQYTYAQTADKIVRKRVTGESNTVNIRSASGVNAHLDYILANYTRKLRLTGDCLPFTYYQSGTCAFKMSGCTSSTQIWKVGVPGKPTSIVPATLKDGTLEFKLSDNSARYIAVNTGASYPLPEKVGTVANQNLHAEDAYDMVIIVPESGKLTSEAERLADYHRLHDSMRVKVVRADLLYNEFSSGTPDAIAYRKYMKMLYDRAQTEADMPRYLLLFGSCVWDNRMLTPATKYLKPENYLLAWESDDDGVSELNSYVSDDYFGLLGDGEGNSMYTEKIDLGIGRIPVTSAEDARTVVDKTIAYMEGEAVGNWKNDIYMIADDGDENQHMSDADSVVKRIESNYPALQVKHVYLDAFERVTTATGYTYPKVTSLLKTAMRKGALVMNYTGHGAPYCLSHEQVLTLADFKSFSSANIPMWVVASCELTPFDMLTENIGETSLLSGKGAAIAFYSSSRAAYSSYNRNLNVHYMKYVLGKDAKGARNSIGEAARLAKVALVSDAGGGMKDYTSNKLKYALMGDPALVLKIPTYNVVIDKMNGKDVVAERQTLQAGSIAVVKGHIETADGMLVQDFNGHVTMKLLDNLETIVCRNNPASGDVAHTYRERTKSLYEGSDSVTKGQFEIKIPIPLDINYSGEAGKISMYAVNAEQTKEANGHEERFNIGGTAPIAEKDSLGPSMFVYLNSPDFVDGGIVNETPCFHAVLSDSDGINRTGIGLGHDLELIIDGQEQKTYILNDYYQNDFGSYTSGTVSYLIPTLEEGSHRLFFRAWDTKNHASSTLLNFVVKKGLAPQLVEVKATPNPAGSSTTFVIAYDRPETETSFTVEVFDCFGRSWWTHTEEGTSEGIYTINWNLTSNSGVYPPDGLYLYKVTISSGESEKVSKTQKLIIKKQ